MILSRLCANGIGKHRINRQRAGYSRVRSTRVAGLSWPRRSCGTISFRLRENWASQSESAGILFVTTYSTLLRSTGAELKIMQELLRHSTIRVTLDTHTQAVTTEKRNAQEAVVALLFREKTQET